MIKPTYFQNTLEKTSKWFAVAAIPLSNPPYQNNYAPVITNTVIRYTFIYNQDTVTINHLITYNGINVTQSTSYESYGKTLPSFAPKTDIPCGYVLDNENRLLYACIKLDNQYEGVIYQSDCVGIYDICPKPIESVTQNITIGTTMLMNFGGITVNGAYGVSSLENVNPNNATSLNTSTYSGLFFTYKANKSYAIPFMVYNGELKFDGSEVNVTASVSRNIITFTSSSKIPMFIVSFV